MHINGQCHCGRVTYEADIDPLTVSICHCTDCQSLTGSAYRVTVICGSEQVRMEGGTRSASATSCGQRGRSGAAPLCRGSTTSQDCRAAQPTELAQMGAMAVKS